MPTQTTERKIPLKLVTILGLLLILWVPAVSGPAPVKCGGVVTLGDDLHGFPKLRHAAAALVDTADFPERLVSPGNNFVIHYYPSGPNAAAPGLVDSAAAVAEEVLAREIGELGFRDVPRFADGRYHIYLQDLGAMFGYTAATQPVPGLPSGDYYSLLVLDNDFPPEVFGLPTLDALRVTLAHEFFHAVQFGYANLVDQAYYMELSAVWMENLVYPDIGDYRRYLPAYLQSLDRPMYQTDGAREYGMVLWAQFLDYFCDPERTIQRSTLEALGAQGGQALYWNYQFSGRDPEDLWCEFYAWNLLTGSWNTPLRGYPDAESLPEVSVPFWENPVPGTVIPPLAGIFGSGGGGALAEIRSHSPGGWLLNRRTGTLTRLAPGDSLQTGLDARHLLGQINPWLEERDPGMEAVTLAPLSGSLTLLGVYPNPVREQLQLRFLALENVESTFRIYDLLGREKRKLRISAATEGFFTEGFRVQDLPSGLYVISGAGVHHRFQVVH